MSDPFTSVQWDREDDTETNDTREPVNATNTQPTIGEEDEELADSGLLQNEVVVKPSSPKVHDTHEVNFHQEVDTSDVNQKQKAQINSPTITQDQAGGLPAHEGDKKDKTQEALKVSNDGNDDADDDDDDGELIIDQSDVPKMSSSGTDSKPTSTLASVPAKLASQNPEPGAVPYTPEVTKSNIPNYNVPDEEFFVQSRVSSPLTEYDGQTPFTSYLIETKTNHSQLKTKVLKVRRRYSDFDFLYECLSSDYPTLIIPPLPNKQRLEYIKGGRFTEEFTLKRTVSLNSFLSRICKHPILKHSQIFHLFLEDSDYWNTYKQNLKLSNNGLSEEAATQNIETISDFFMNAFKKSKSDSKYNKEFQEIYENSNRLQSNLNKIDTIYGKVLKKQNDIAEDFATFSDEFSKLGLLLSNDLTGTRTEESAEFSKEITEQISSFSNNTKKMSERLNILSHDIEYNYLTSLKDLDHYISQLKNLIKSKDDKLLDYEALSNYLEKAIHERQNLMNGGSMTSTTEGALSFFSKKLENMSLFSSGSSHVSSDQMIHDRINKLGNRIELLEKEKANSLKIVEKYESDILSEYQHFEKIKTEEINGSLRNLSESYLEYYVNLVNDWKFLKIENVDNSSNGNIGDVVNKNILSEDNELFTHNDVLKNNEILSDSLKKLQANQNTSGANDSQ